MMVPQTVRCVPSVEVDFAAHYVKLVILIDQRLKE